MHAYRLLLARRGVPRLVVAALITRLSTSVLSLSLLLAAHAATGSYAIAGLALTGHAAALAVFAPIIGRLADRVHPRRVLLACLAVHVPAHAGLLASLLTAGPPSIVVGCAVAVGAGTPPAGAVIRGTWALVVPAEQLPTAYALDAVSNSLTFIGGPLAVTAGLTFAPPNALVAFAATATLCGVVALVSAPALRRDDPPVSAARRPFGPLADPQVVLLLVIAALGALSYGAGQIGAAATTAEHGAAAAVGLMTSAFAAGAVVGGLTYGARRWPGGRRAHLVVLYLASAAGFAAAGLAPTLVLFAVVLAAIGLAEGPRDALEQLLLGDAGSGHRTETFAWLNTFMWIGYGLGTAVTGPLVAPVGAPAPLIVGAAACVLAAALARRTRVPLGLAGAGQR